MKKMKRHVLKDPPTTEEEIEDDEGEEEAEGEEEYDEEDFEDDEEDEEEDEEEAEEEDEEDDEEDEEESFSGYESPARRPRRGFMSRGYDDDDDNELSEEMAAAIRAGKYKPKKHDPWSAHTLYSMLRDLGKL